MEADIVKKRRVKKVNKRENENSVIAGDSSCELSQDEKLRLLQLKAQKVVIAALKSGLPPNKVLSLSLKTDKRDSPKNRRLLRQYVACFIILLIAVGVVHCFINVDQCCFYLFPTSQCLLPNSALLMEAMRPESACEFCIGGAKVAQLAANATLETAQKWFAPLAYSGRPAVARGAALGWPAMRLFSVEFFRNLYEAIPGALESVEEECQFLPFSSEFSTLAEALRMPPSRATLEPGQKPFYFGWSNCHPDVAETLRSHYTKPRFIPSESETSALDWIFMGGYGPGASLHLDYVRRPSWQAQISGRKTWYLYPPTECEDICTPLNVTVETGDIVFIDTNIWFHTTQIHEGHISITIGSEYD